MSQEKTLKNLENLGFSKTEAQVYLLLGKKGAPAIPATAPDQTWLSAGQGRNHKQVLSYGDFRLHSIVSTFHDMPLRFLRQMIHSKKPAVSAPLEDAVEEGEPIPRVIIQGNLHRLVLVEEDPLDNHLGVTHGYLEARFVVTRP